MRTSRLPHRAPIALAAALLGLAVVVSACSSPAKGGGTLGSTGSPTASTSTTAARSAARSTAPVKPTSKVHVRLLESDGQTYGVGMPIIVYFNKKITSASAFLHATTVTVNGANAGGSWYFELSGSAGEVLEAHYRLQNYWPAHAVIKMNMPVNGLSAGPGLAFDDSLTLSMATGTANISQVDGSRERMTVTSDGVLVRTMSVSLGAATTPTYTGTAIVEQKGEDEPGTNTLRPTGEVRMIGTGSDQYDLLVPWSVRVTNSGEYIHAASWNTGNIGIRSTSNGCTNLNVSDAQWFYGFAQIGDVVTYANTGGPAQPYYDGYGDWNLPWPVWQTGGLLSATS